MGEEEEEAREQKRREEKEKKEKKERFAMTGLRRGVGGMESDPCFLLGEANQTRVR